jgi:hypothetical protein
MLEGMRVYPKIVLAALGSLLLFGVGAEVADRPASAPVPAGVTPVGFGQLAVDLPTGPARPGSYLGAVPRAVRALDGQRVMVRGFMIPTRMADRKVAEFLLVRSQASCCFGLPPRLGEIVEVRMAGAPVDSLMDRVVGVVGCLHVQERWTGPSLGSLYQMDGQQVLAASGAHPLKAPPPGLE